MKGKRNNKIDYRYKYNEIESKYLDCTNNYLKLRKLELEDDIYSLESDKSHEEFSNLLSITTLFIGLWWAQLLNNAVYQLFAMIGAIILIRILIKCYDRIQPHKDKIDKQRRELRVELLCVNEALSKLNTYTGSEVSL